MERCAELIDGWLLPPGRAFGMRRAIGEPTTARGFRSGPSIVDGVLEEDTGGGICQVSTVLFNAALFGGLEILDKHNHSTDIWGEKRLIELGRDAAFAYAIKDLKFRNASTEPVVVQLEVASDQSALVGRVIGQAEPAKTIEVTSSVLEELAPDPSLATPNSVPVAGWAIRTMRTQTVGRTSTVTFDHIDHYRPTFIAPQ